ncbi:MAG TPA: DUF3570 domain-containing protein [Polyangiales bacterium]|nr:DUF3570 domain-containing protein [Polyangiales bacterium]
MISPRLHLHAPVGDDSSHVDLAYAVDVWTSASVDIVASASAPVTEQRDELNVAVDRVFGDLRLAAAYRYSTEPDYESHGGSLSLSWDLANKAFTLAWSLGGSADTVGRAGDTEFAEAVNTLNTGLALTQVLDPDTLLQLIYDFGYSRGYLASAYRFVSFGSPGPCRSTAPLCRPEENPRERMRHAIALRARRAWSSEWSSGASYRAYLDDWGLISHTARVDLAWAPQPKATLALGYRFYTQNAADHYAAQYQPSDLALTYFTRDKELSPLTSHRIGLELDWVWELGTGQAGLLTALEVATTFYRYADFPMLASATALEVTFVTGMEWE